MTGEDGNVLSSLPAEIGSLSNLQLLHVGKCTTIGKDGAGYRFHNFRLNSFWRVWKNVAVLMTGEDGNVLSSLPAEIGRLSSLKELYLGKLVNWHRIF